MSNEPITLSVQIIDKTYTVKCPPEQAEGLKTAAKLLDERMRDIYFSGKVIGMERVAIITALNIYHEFLTVAGSGNQELKAAEERISKLQQLVEGAITQTEQLEL